MTNWTSKQFGLLPQAGKKPTEALLRAYLWTVILRLTEGDDGTQWREGKEHGLWCALDTLGLQEARATAFRMAVDHAAMVNEYRAARDAKGGK
jgi:hypothetical protein